MQLASGNIGRSEISPLRSTGLLTLVQQEGPGSVQDWRNQIIFQKTTDHKARRGICSPAWTLADQELAQILALSGAISPGAEGLYFQLQPLSFSRIGDRRSCLGSCLHCGTEVAVPGGSTTGMFSHLAVHHPDHYREAKEPHLLPSPPLPPQSPFSNLSQASRTPPSLVSVKSLAPADNIFPHLGVTFSVRPLPQPAPTPPDLVIHCRL